MVLLNEFDFDADGEAIERFRSNYLAAGQAGAEPIEYPYWFSAAVNTGMPSGFDLDNDGTVGDPNDAFGLGQFPGQYGMVILSQYPIAAAQVRTFQNLLWADMPDARLPGDPATGDPGVWYSAEELAVLPLSSTSHWDVPIDIDGDILHLLASHRTRVLRPRHPVRVRRDLRTVQPARRALRPRRPSLVPDHRRHRRLGNLRAHHHLTITERATPGPNTESVFPACFAAGHALTRVPVLAAARPSTPVGVMSTLDPVAMPHPIPPVRLQLVTEGTEPSPAKNGELRLLWQDLSHPGG